MTASEVEPVTARRVALGTGALVAGRLVGAGMSLVALRLTSVYLGPDDFGAFVAATSVVTLVGTLADLGLVTTAARDIAAAPTHEAARRVIGVNLAMRVALSLLLVPVAVALGWILYPSADATRTAVVLLAPLLAVTAIQSCAEAVLVGRGRSDLRAVTDVLAKALLLAAAVAVVRGDLGYRTFLTTSVAAAAVASGGALVLAARHVRPALVFDLRVWRATLAIALPLGLVQALNMLYFKIDSVLLSLWRSPAEVGEYGVAYKVFELVLALPSFFMLTLLPAMAVANPERTRALVQRAVDVLLTMAAPITVVGVLLAPTIVELVADDDFDGAVAPLRWLLVGAAASFVSAAFGNAIVATGQQRHLVRMSIVVVVVNIAVNAVAIPTAGTSGAAIAIVVTEVVAMALVARTFRARFGATSFLQLVKVVPGVALMVAGHFALRSVHPFIEGALLLVAFAAGLTVVRGWPRGAHA